MKQMRSPTASSGEACSNQSSLFFILGPRHTSPPCPRMATRGLSGLHVFLFTLKKGNIPPGSCFPRSQRNYLYVTSAQWTVTYSFLNKSLEPKKTRYVNWCKPIRKQSWSDSKPSIPCNHLYQIKHPFSSQFKEFYQREILTSSSAC